MSQGKRDAAKLLFAALDSQAPESDDDDDLNIMPPAPASRAAPESLSADVMDTWPGSDTAALNGGASASQAIDLSDSPPRQAAGYHRHKFI